MNNTMIFRMDIINELLKKERFQVEAIDSSKTPKNKAGYILKSPECNCSPIIYWDDEIWEQSDEEIADMMRDAFQKHSLNLDVSTYLNRDYILSKVIPKVYNENRKFSMDDKDIVYLSFLDMIIVFCVPIDELTNEGGLASMNITHSILRNLNIELDELLMAAKLNTENICEIVSLSQLLSVIGFDDLSELDDECPCTVVTNSYGVNGAACIISENVLDKVSKRIGGRFAILPSSIHEVMCVPLPNKEELPNLYSTVSTINNTQVKEDERLADNVYVWEDGVLSQFA